MDTRILVTLGPSSLNEETVKKIAQHAVHLFRINLSHTPLDAVAETIEMIRQWTDVPICIDSEELRSETSEWLTLRWFLWRGIGCASTSRRSWATGAIFP